MKLLSCCFLSIKWKSMVTKLFSYQHSSKYLHVLQKKVSQVWNNIDDDRIVIFRWTVPLSYTVKILQLLHRREADQSVMVDRLINHVFIQYLPHCNHSEVCLHFFPVSSHATHCTKKPSGSINAAYIRPFNRGVWPYCCSSIDISAFYNQYNLTYGRRSWVGYHD